jgi:AraC-like DNA-binding protein
MPENDTYNSSRVVLGAAPPQERFQRILKRVRTGSLSTVRDLACEFNLSASHLQHLFKAETGSCLGRSLTEERLRRAATLLLKSDGSVKEIAYSVGYKHPSSFVRAFTRYFGSTPTVYRRATEFTNDFGTLDPKE